MRKVCLLGASGSIGSQTLDILNNDKNNFLLKSISIGKQVNKIPLILEQFKSIDSICVKEETDYFRLVKEYPAIKFFYGDLGLLELIKASEADMVVNALVGFSGLLPSLKALELDKILCLANKESLVVGGELIKTLLNNGHGKIYPIDSEHVAIAKCLSKVNKNDVKKIIITGSGGAFRNLNRNELKNVTPTLALNHPTWKMGPKITIDSDTMFNKGFEVIEASILFDFDINNIEVILHDESYLHSAIELNDGTLIGEVNKPDMHRPIAYALYEGNIAIDDIYVVKDLSMFTGCHFHKFDKERYPAVGIAIDAYKKGNIYPAVCNAAVETCDYLFLDGKIAFSSIEEMVDKAIKNTKQKQNMTLSDILIADKLTREYLHSLKGE